MCFGVGVERGGGCWGWVEAGILLGPETTNRVGPLLGPGFGVSGLSRMARHTSSVRPVVVGWVLVVGVSVGLRVV